ncbi:isoprenylcysteine carboxylmethyltransferase family protein [Reichenbachiella agarivorans]|uniref:Isoprenylcysteine carboxylmethyltransferase family protein n=1 Tax=Reichenbachiella agarivorans TaxID=2979464 RepID=A0ABY6CMK8_9BACT|nr:isoprenylcysteine carboxylmethyltransferase family protein [Reichenbachiella agarivorans]UXP31742.1 isoprenylcysteine carboxylmethyltransferase family protein [Reichenbachiella agarivorans]
MKKIIPPILFFFCIIIMVATRILFVVKEIIPTPYNYSGILLIALGIMITITVRKRFEKIDTEIHTFKKPRKLVTTGLFKMSRNPIYLGFAISLIGVWILLGTVLPIIGCLIFIIITNFHYIPFEEQLMEKTFGDEFKEYKSKVRRWI